MGEDLQITETEQSEQQTSEKSKPKLDLKLFGRWSTDIDVADISLRPYMNLSPMHVAYSAGRNIKKQFWKSKKSIVERLFGKLMIPGHKGKKHYWTSGPATGQINTQYRIVKKTFEIIESKTKKNPVEVFIRAIEKGSPTEGIASIEYGGVRYHKAADLSPQRRIDLALRWMTQGAFQKSRKNKRKVWEALADEIMLAAQGDAKSNTVAKGVELQRQAQASR